MIAFRWTESQPIDKGLVDAIPARTEMSSEVGLLNGALDRDNLPADSITADMVVPDAMYTWWIADQMQLANRYLTYTVAVGQPTGCSHGSVLYGWISDDKDMDITTIEGSLQIEFHTWFWRSHEYASYENEVWVAFRILVDGAEVANTGRIHQPNGIAHLLANVAIPSGPHTVVVQCRFSSPDGTEVSTNRMGYYDSGQLFVMNRYR